ncbi:MAG: replication initiation protein [Azospirillaceae bacterium]|nr:replication initiation protein [Azospirillaceae bacterium]
MPKPRGTIEIIETGGGLTLSDKKLFNVILAHSWDKLADATAALPPFRAATADLKRAIGEETEHSNARLKSCFDRLMSVRVEFPYLSADGEVKEGGAPLLSFRALPKGKGYAEWSFPAELRPALAEPSAWARIHLAVCTSFSSKYALALYELLSVRVNLREPDWEVEIDAFRQLLSVKNSSANKNFGILQREVLERAVREVNELSAIECSYTPIRSPSRGRPVIALRFTIRKKERAALTSAARATEFAIDPVGPVGRGLAAGARDADTVDLEDGKTDRDRPVSVLGLKRRISDTAVEQLRTDYPGIDIEGALDRWAEWASGQTGKIRNADLAFAGFVRKMAGEVVSMIPVVPPAITGTEVRAPRQAVIDRLASEPLDVRTRFYKRARDLGAPEVRAAVAASNIHKWVEWVADEAAATLR